MELTNILDHLGSSEKDQFIKIINGIISDIPKNAKKINNILNGKSKELKEQDNNNIAGIFLLVKDEFADLVKKEFVNLTSQLDILIDIVIKDGNRIMKQDRLDHLYENQLRDFTEKKAAFKKSVYSNNSGIDKQRKKALKTYLDFFKTVYYNDWETDQDSKILTYKIAILLTLSQNLGLSQQDVELINNMIIPVKKLNINTVINRLENIGVIFYSRKTSTVYAADEIVRVLKKVRGQEAGDKLFIREPGLVQEPPDNKQIKKVNIKDISCSDIPIKTIHIEAAKVTKQEKFNTYLCDS